MRSAQNTLRNWMPYRIFLRGVAPRVDWCFMDSDRFTQPFFSDTIQRRMRSPFNLLFQHRTSIECLADVAEASEIIPPTGFIFHMSRCGSTLVSQMLASLNRNVVVSEAPPIDSAIAARQTDGSGGSDRREWLKWIVAVLGRQRIESEQHYFIKFDSWNALDISYITSIFPNVPWIFIYRDPVEVLVSQMKQRGSQMVPGSIDRLLPGLSLMEALTMSPEVYCSRVLGQFCLHAVACADDPNVLLVNYNELPDAVVGKITNHFGVSYSDDEIACMNQAATFDAKSPRKSFEPDSDRKKNEATEAIQDAIREWVTPVYEKLEELRNADLK